MGPAAGVLRCAALAAPQVLVAPAAHSEAGSGGDPPPRVRKLIHFVRHAEGHHNVAGKKDPLKGYLRKDLEDAHITVDGITQCESLRKNSLTSGKVADIKLVVVSPMNRTLQTASHSFPHLIGRVPWVALEHIRERTGLHPCDRRKSRSEHAKSYPHVAFDHIRDEDDPLFPQYLFREPEVKVEERARAFLAWLAQRPEEEVLVVSHSNFLRTLFRKVLLPDMAADGHTFSVRKFDHCEMRTLAVLLPSIAQPEGD